MFMWIRSTLCRTFFFLHPSSFSSLRWSGWRHQQRESNTLHPELVAFSLSSITQRRWSVSDQKFERDNTKRDIASKCTSNQRKRFWDRILKIKNIYILLAKFEPFKLFWAIQINPWQSPIINFMTANADLKV
jgi:hypothetical protein